MDFNSSDQTTWKLVLNCDSAQVHLGPVKILIKSIKGTKKNTCERFVRLFCKLMFARLFVICIETEEIIHWCWPTVLETPAWCFLPADLTLRSAQNKQALFDYWVTFTP